MFLSRKCNVSECNRPAFVLTGETGHNFICATHYTKLSQSSSSQTNVKLVFEMNDSCKNEISNKLKIIEGRVNSHFVGYYREVLEFYKTFKKRKEKFMRFMGDVKDLQTKITEYKTEHLDVVVKLALKLLEIDKSSEFEFLPSGPNLIEKNQFDQQFNLSDQNIIEQSDCVNGLHEQHTIIKSHDSSINEGFHEQILSWDEELYQLTECLEESNFKVEDFKKLLSDIYNKIMRINTRVTTSLEFQKIQDFNKEIKISDLIDKVEELDKNSETFESRNTAIINGFEKKIEEYDGLLKVYKANFDLIISEVNLTGLNIEKSRTSIAEDDLSEENTNKAQEKIQWLINELTIKNRELEEKNISIIILTKGCSSFEQLVEYAWNVYLTADRKLTKALNINEELVRSQKQKIDELKETKEKEIEKLKKLLGSSEYAFKVSPINARDIKDPKISSCCYNFS